MTSLPSRRDKMALVTHDEVRDAISTQEIERGKVRNQVPEDQPPERAELSWH